MRCEEDHPDGAKDVRIAQVLQESFLFCQLTPIDDAAGSRSIGKVNGFWWTVECGQTEKTGAILRLQTYHHLVISSRIFCSQPGEFARAGKSSVLAKVTGYEWFTGQNNGVFVFR